MIMIETSRVTCGIETGAGGLGGVVTRLVTRLPNTTFHVDIGNGHIILAQLFPRKLRMNSFRILPGDKVTIQMSRLRT